MSHSYIRQTAIIVLVTLGTQVVAPIVQNTYANNTTYYVDASLGSDANDGLTESGAWQTISRVNSGGFLPGDQILFKCGEGWNEQLVIQDSGIPGSPIIFDQYGASCDGTNRPAINYTGAPQMFESGSVSYITIQNFDFSAGDSPTGVIEFSGIGTDIQVSNSTIGNPNGTCIKNTQSDNFIVSGNTISNCMYGIDMGTMSGTISGNTFSAMGTGSSVSMSETSSGSRTIANNDFSNLNGSAITFGENTNIIQNIIDSSCEVGENCAAIKNVSLALPRDLNSTIQQNFITDVGTGTYASVYQLDAIRLGGVSSGVTINANTISNAQNAINLVDSSNNSIVSNTFYNPRNYAIKVLELTAGSATGNTINTNTFLTYNADYSMVRIENTVNNTDVLANFSGNKFLNVYKPKLPIIEILKQGGDSSQVEKSNLTTVDGTATNFTYFGYKTYTSTGSYSGSNLLTNGAFGTDITGWSTDVLTLSHDGTGLTMHAAQGANNTGTISSNTFTIANGALYEISGILKNITDSEGHDVKVRLTNSVDTLYADREFNVVATDGSGTTFKAYVTANTDAVDAELHFILNNPNTDLELDTLVVRKVVGLVRNSRSNEAIIATNSTSSTGSVSCASLGIPAPFCGQYVDGVNAAATFSLSVNPYSSKIIFWNNATNILNRPTGTLVPSNGSIPNGSNVTLTWTATNSLVQEISGLTNTGGFTYNVAASGSMTIIPPNDGTTTYSFSTTNDIGTIIYTADVITSNTPPVVDPAFATGSEDSLSITGIVTASDSNSGGTISYTKFTDPVNGVILNFEASGSFDYRPNADFCGTDTFEFRAWDAFGLGNDAIGNPGIATITVTCDNDTPVAIDDNLSGTGGMTGLLDVMANDTDVDSPYVPQTFSLVGVTQPANGVVSISGTMIEFTPNAPYYGPDSFTYTMQDQSGAVSNVATVNLTVAPGMNLPPQVSGNSYSFNEDTPYVDVLSGSDINGDALSFTATSLPTNGTLSIVGSGFTYTPNANYHGADSFVFEANDGTYNSSGATINLTINSVEDLPVANNDTINVQMDTATTIDALINDSDGDNLSPTPPNQGLTITGFTQPTNGTVSAVGTGFLYTPNSLYLGSDSFDYSIIDSNGNISNTGTVSISVTTTNQPPVADSGSFITAEDTLLVNTLSGSDPDLTPVTFVLDTTVATGTLNLSSTGEFTYMPSTNYNGTVSFTFHVSDGVFSSSGQTVTIDVTPDNDIPVATTDTFTGTEDTIDTFFPLTNDFDPDIGDSIVISSIINQPTHGVAVLSGGTEIIYTPTADYCGPDAFVYQVMDQSGSVSGGGTSNINVTCTNDAPTVSNSSYSVLGNIPTSSGNSIVATLTGVDIDGDPLTYTVISGASNGTLNVSATGVMDYTPNLGFSGSDSFSYSVNDGTVSSSGATVTITVNPNGLNLTPTADPDSQSTNEDTPLSGIVTGNDPEGAILTFSASTLPTHGTLVLQSSGSYTYTPTANYFGPDSFTFTVNDGVYTSSAATISLTVDSINDTPVANIDFVNGTEDTTSQFAPISNDIDVDVGDILTFNGFTQGANGTITQSGTLLIYTPTANYCGNDSMSYSIIDQSGAVSNTGTVNISLACVNDVPVGANDATGTGTEDTAITIPVLTNDTDIEDGTPVSIANLTQPSAGGSVGIVGSNVVFSPTTNYCGSAPITFTYQARDSGTALSNVVTVTIPAITCVNDAPVTQAASFTMTGNVVINSGTLDGSGNLVGFSATNHILNGSIIATDVEGDPLSFTLATLPSSGTASLTNTGYLTYIPAYDYVGSMSFTVTSNDGAANSTPAIISICVISPNPDIARPSCAPAVPVPPAPAPATGPGGGGGGGGGLGSIAFNYKTATAPGTDTALTTQLLLRTNQLSQSGQTFNAAPQTHNPAPQTQKTPTVTKITTMTSDALLQVIQTVVDTATMNNLSSTGGSRTIRSSGITVLTRILSSEVSTEEKILNIESTIASITDIEQSSTTLRESFTLQHLIRVFYVKRANLMKMLSNMVS